MAKSSKSNHFFIIKLLIFKTLMGNLNNFKSILNAFWKLFKNECFEKIFKFKIFTDKTIAYNILNNLKSLS